MFWEHPQRLEFEAGGSCEGADVVPLGKGICEQLAHRNAGTVAVTLSQRILAAATPFRVSLTSTFRAIDHRAGLLIQGPAGWGEFSPFADYDPDRDGYWLSAALESAFLGWPQPVRDRVGVNAIMPVRSPEQTQIAAQEAVTRYGCRTIKVKVADPNESQQRECQRIAAVRAALDQAWPDGSGRIRLDANAGWSLTTARERLDQLGQFDIEYVEQPCRTRADLAALHRDKLVPVAVDETIRIDRAFTAVSEIADVAIVKVAPLGGSSAALAVADRLDVPVVISGAMETSVGLAASLATAAALPQSRFDHGLGTGVLLATDVTQPTLVPSDGELRPIAVAPDRGLLAEAESSLSSREIDHWRKRLTAALAYVPSQILELVP